MRSLLVVLFALAPLMTGCLASPPTPTFQVTLRLSPTPALIGPTRLIIDVADAAGTAVQGAVVSVEGLPEQGANRAPAASDATEEGGGRYVVPAFEFAASGRWTLTVSVTDSSGAHSTRAFPVLVYGGN